jgi:hypothetical protein
MEQKPKMLVFLMALLVVTVLVLYLLSSAREMIQAVRSKYKTMYLLSAVRNSMGSISAGLFKIMFALLCIVLLWKAAVFKPYILPAYIPGQTPNIGQYIDLLRERLQVFFSGVDTKAPYVIRMFEAADVLLSYIFMVSFIAGIPLLHIGFAGLKKHPVKTDTLLFCIGAGVVFSFILATAASVLSGLPAELNVKGIVIAWIYIFVHAMKIFKNQEECVEYG